ncbi:hypothetical protein LY474_08020 [Myxococcus stipitatus]|uniref:hypothetical protein n=1 Tax=Myxococcus stipitatus TaxID=83455 RepID=UPI001F1BFDDB|nr:hypothetical protein [Myxococcus stipitatus]MCE9667757.1 hypothetical protein [Myxococcus stipitatus]
MDKHEMSKEQLAQRTLIADTLRAAGWRTSDQNELFESGGWAFFEVNMTYKNPVMRLELRYSAKDALVYLDIQNLEGRGVLLHVKFGDKLAELLKEIVGFQQQISPSNFRRHVNRIVLSCPETYAAIGDEDDGKLARLVVDERLLAPDDAPEK